MKLSDPIKISLKNLLAAKFRSFLTILGIIIGVASVIIIMAIGQSAQALILDQVSGLGSNLIGIIPGAQVGNGPPSAILGVVTTTLKNADLKAILDKNNVPGAVNASGYVSGVATATYQSTSIDTSYQGVSATFPDVESAEVGSGRFFTADEDQSLARVAVLGSSTAANLFNGANPLGKTITLKNTNFTVIGVMKPRGSVAFTNSDDLIYIPLDTAQKLMLGIDYLNFMRVKIDTTADLTQATFDIKTTLQRQHQIKNSADDDFAVQNTAQAVSTITTITNVIKYFLAGIAAISLLVGGIGIMNIMLISVQERIREVGLRKAVGARNRHIVTQFLIESVFITLTGGIFGIVLGAFITFLAAVIINALGYTWQFIVPLDSVILGTSISIIIGVIFGLYPAMKASRISPIEALRYE
jgi:putative ABC transport system permease protein